MANEVKLTTVQARIARMLSQGQTPRTVALTLGITTQKVYDHMEHIRDRYEKAGEI
jgi:DNA-binding CsgD family transcriptional regulator